MNNYKRSLEVAASKDQGREHPYKQLPLRYPNITSFDISPIDYGGLYP